MKNIIKTGLFILVLTGLMSCNEFGDVNDNPNAPTFVGTENLLSGALAQVGGQIGASTYRSSGMIGGTFGELYVQHLSQITYTEDSRYQSTRTGWNFWYNVPLSNLNQVIALNSGENASKYLSGGSNSNQIGVARIAKAYFYNQLTERYGGIPYSQALKGDENVLLPSYDSEADVYTDLFKELKEASAQLDGGSVAGDIIFGGNTNAWKKFANTLRAQIALKLADVDPSNAKAQFLEAYNSGLLDNGVMYDYLPEEANENPWYNRFRTRTDFGVSSTLVDYLVATNDPRLMSFADPAKDSGTIVPMPYGLESSEYAPSSVSFPNSTYMKAQDRDIPIISAAQVALMKTEAAARGWISGDAAMYYAEAVKASFAQWGVSADKADEYLAQDAVKYDAANWKKSLGMQSWVSLYGQGYEAWREWRKFDYPQLTPAENPLNPSQDVPVREMYPATEQNLNTANYDAAVSSLLGGKDSDGVKLWWDVN